MDRDKIQKNAEILEELIERDIHDCSLTAREFNALNNLLLELAIGGLYKVSDKYFKED